MNYSDKLKDPRWQKRRLKIFERDNWACVACGRTDQTLHVHHNTYVGEPWDAPDEALKTLCEGCHNWEHSTSAWVLRLHERNVAILKARGFLTNDLGDVLFALALMAPFIMVADGLSDILDRRTKMAFLSSGVSLATFREAANIINEQIGSKGP